MAARPEAGAFAWNQLHSAQRQVVADLIGWLFNFVGEATPKAARAVDADPLPWQVDERRRQSNVALISGVGGSGRSSVLLTLLHLFRAGLAGRSRNVLGPPATEPRSKELRAQVEAALPKLDGRLVPIRILDFRPLPSDTALVPWIAAGIRELSERLAEPHRDAPAPRVAARWRPDYEKEPGAKRAYIDLVAGAAAGWIGITEARKAVLDPEAYAEELKEADRARIDFGDSWRRFVDAVLEDALKGGADADLRITPSPCLVVPIEDVDANPLRCRELLELVRTLWHPRVVFFLTGSEALVVKTLEISFFGGFARLGADGSSGTEVKSLVEVRPSPRRLAVDALDRATPTAQRFAIQDASFRERVEFLGGGLDAPVQHDETEKDLAPGRLAGLLAKDPWAANALPPTPRRLQDVRLRLDARARERAGCAARVHELWLEAVDHSETTLAERRMLLRYVELMPPEDPRSAQLRVAFEGRLRPLIARRTSLDQPGRDLRVATVRALEARAALSGGEQRALDPQLASLVVLASDLASDEEGGTFLGRSPAPDGLAFPSMANYMDPLPEVFPGEAWRTKVLCCWPLPDWYAPLDFALFDAAWQVEEEKLRRGETEVGSLLRAFLLHVKGVATGRAPADEIPGDLDWAVEAVLDAARPAIESRGTQTWRARAFGLWAAGPGLLLAAPESGLSPKMANSMLEPWLNRLHTFSDKDQVRDWAREARVRRLVAPLVSELGPAAADKIPRSGVEKAIEAIDKAHSEFLFAKWLRT